jgi:hypothetical protein
MSTRNRDLEAKIRTLLDKAESTNYPEEANALTAKAQELMARYAIDESLLRAEARPADRGRPGVSDVSQKQGPYLGPLQGLVSTVAKANRCRVLVASGGRGREAIAHVIGFESDRTNVIALYQSLLIQANRELDTPEVRARKSAECYQPGHKVAWQNAWMKGYTTEIGVRLAEANRRAEAMHQARLPGERSVALALRDTRREVDAFINDRFGPLRKSYSSAGLRGGSGRSMGAAAGRRADIGGGGRVAGSSLRRALAR